MRDLNRLTLSELFAELLPGDAIDRLLALAIEEDMRGVGDVTSMAMIPASRTATATLTARKPGIIAGMAVLQHTRHPLFSEIAASADIRVADGQPCASGRALAELTGSLRAMLAIERTLLNLLSHLSGVATLTARFVQAIEGTRAVICDTRKTTPGLRGLEKYAVRCGGGTTHRLGLFDAMLIKDNHIVGVPIEKLARTLSKAVIAARNAHALRFVEVEVDSLQQFQHVLKLDAGLVDVVLLDNMSVGELRDASLLRSSHRPDLLLEASGGVTLDNVRSIASTGVDRISVGAITHSAPALDIGLDIT